MTADKNRKICRACLRLGECKFYKLKRNKRYFTDFLQIDLDTFSQYWLCCDCHYRINNTLDFSNKVKMANSVFLQFFNKLHFQDIVEIITTNRAAIGFPKLELKSQTCEDGSSFYFNHVELEVNHPESFECKSDTEQDYNVDDNLGDFSDDYNNKNTEILVKASQVKKTRINSKRLVVVRLNQLEQIEEFERLRMSKQYLDACYKCSMCYRGFKCQDRFLTHLVKHNKISGDYQCDMCKQRYPTSHHLETHIKAHARLYKCALCDYRNISKTSVLDHYKLHHENDTFHDTIPAKIDYKDDSTDTRIQSCEIKEEPPEEIRPEEGHKAEVYEENKKIIKVILNTEEEKEMFQNQALQKRYTEALYKCKLCYKGFLYKDTYHIHLEKHSKFPGKFECDICHIFLPTERKRKSHRANHSRVYRCATCNYVRYDKKTVQIHYSVKHGDSHSNDLSFLRRKRTKTKVECCHCGRFYATRDTLAMHIRRKHAEDISSSLGRPYECGECGKRFRFHHDVKIHSSVHLKNRDYYCVECDLSFKTPYALSNHFKYTKKHINSEHFIKCPLCPSTVINKQELKRHTERIHTRSYKFKCEQCPKKYCQKNDLNRHIKRSHAEGPRERKNICDICGKSFLHKKTLLVHRNVHTGDRPYKCELCTATFIYPAALFTHNQLVHLKIKRNCDLKKLKNKQNSPSA